MTAPAILETPIHAPDHPAGGGRLVATDGRTLPLESAALEATAGGGVARTVLRQTFVNNHDAPLAVEYTLPLPADGAVSGFSFTIGDRRVVGEIDRRSAARERFEEAIADGRTAAILEQDRSSLFCQEVGNIPAGETVVCETVVDQPLVWLGEGMWEWRFPTVVGPRYMGAPGRVADAKKIAVDVSADPLPVRMSLDLEVTDEPTGAIEGAERFAGGGARLDRDVVIRWPVSGREVGLSLKTCRPDGDDQGYGLLTVVPPLPEAAMKPVPRDLIALIDTSGSMSGLPLDHARRIVCSLIDSLGDRDRLELVEFSNAPNRWRAEAVRCDAATRRAAIKWVKKLQAGGGTEMRTGMLEAMKTLRPDSQRQVLLVTDGYVGFETEIVRTAIDELPAGCRLHTLGVGSAVNRSLLGPVARAGNGTCAISALDDDIERASARLLAHMNAPLVTDLEISGDAVLDAAPLQLPDLYAGAPALINLALDPRGGAIRVRGETASGPFDHEIEAPAQSPGDGDPAIAALYGRERVEDLETRIAGGGEDLDDEIEAIGLGFQISTRLTSWVAIGDVIDGGGEAIREAMPHEIVHGTSIAAFGLRPGTAMMTMTRSTLAGGLVARHGAPPSMPMPMRHLPASVGPRKATHPLALFLWLALIAGLAVAIYFLIAWIF